MLLLLIAMLASSAAESKPAKLAAPEPAYFSDRIGAPVQPLTSSIDFGSREFMVVQTPDGALQIAYRDIRSLSYITTGVGALQLTFTVYHRLLTIGFESAEGLHHNLVVQLEPKDSAQTLKTIASRTGLKVGEAPR